MLATRVRATALLDLPAVVIAAGGDPYPALRQAGIDPAILARADLTIPAETVAWLLDGLAERHAIPDLGLRIDHALLSPTLAETLVSADPDKAERERPQPSDHVPVVVSLS